MNYLFAVIGIALVLGVWSLYVRVGLISDAQMRQTRQALESLKHELAILWVALSSEPTERAKRREEFGFSPLYVYDELVTSYFWPHREHYKELNDKLKHLKSSSWDYKDAADRERKAKEMEELRLSVGAMSASMNPQDKEAWDKLCEERLQKELRSYGIAQKEQK